MFKKYSSVNEIEESFEKFAADEYSREETLVADKKERAINYIKEARDILNNTGLHKRANNLSRLLNKLGAEEFEEEWGDEPEEDVETQPNSEAAEKFSSEVQRIAQKLSYDQDVSDEDPLLVEAAKLYLKYQND